jgi:membrane protease YdiL (CAAX protease family)
VENSSPSQILPDSPIVSGPNAFRPGFTLLALLGMVALAFGIGVVAVVAYLLSHGFSITRVARDVPFALALQVLIDICVVIYLVLVLPPLTNSTLKDLGFRVPTAREIGIALLGALAMVVVVNGIGTIIDKALHTKHEQEAIKLFLSVHDPVVKAGFAALAVIVAPIAEEFAFRVFIYNAVRRYAAFWIAALVSGVCFGAAHGDKYAFVPLIFGGVILCAVYARTRNAWMSMITHGVFNAVSVVALYFAPQLTK